MQAWGCRTYQGKSTERECLRSKQRRGRRDTSTVAKTADIAADIPVTETRCSSVSCSTSAQSELLTASDEDISFGTWGGPFVSLEQYIGIFRIDEYPLHAAAQIDDTGMIHRFCGRGYDINSRTRDTQLTPLHVAVRFKASQACISTILSWGANLALADSHGNVPLHWAVRWNYPAVVYLMGRLPPFFDGFNAQKLLEAKNDNGFAFLHLALIGHQKGFWTPKDLDSLIPKFRLLHIYFRHDIRSSSGARPIDLAMTSRRHDLSHERGRVAWWSCMFSRSTCVPSPKFLDKILPRNYDTLEQVFFPGTNKGLLDSILKELPALKLRATHVELHDIVTLGSTLLQEPPDVLEPQKLFDDLVEAQCSEFWAMHPQGLESIWNQTWIKKLIKDYLVYEGVPLRRNTLSKSCLIRAIDEVRLPPEQHQYHIAGFFARHNPQAAFYKDIDGRLPIFEAAERGLKTVVVTMLDAAMRDILDDKARLHSSIYDRYWPNLSLMTRATGPEKWLLAMAWAQSGPEFVMPCMISSSAWSLLHETAIMVHLRAR